MMSSMHKLAFDHNSEVITDKSTTTVKILYSQLLGKEEIPKYVKMSELGIGPHVKKWEVGVVSYVEMEYFPKHLGQYFEQLPQGERDDKLLYTTDRLFYLFQIMLRNGTFCTDIKCENVLVDDRGKYHDEPKIVLTDFGADSCNSLNQELYFPLLIMCTSISISLYLWTGRKLFVNYAKSLYYVFLYRFKIQNVMDVPETFDNFMKQYLKIRKIFTPNIEDVRQTALEDFLRVTCQEFQTNEDDAKSYVDIAIRRYDTPADSETAARDAYPKSLTDDTDLNAAMNTPVTYSYKRDDEEEL